MGKSDEAAAAPAAKGRKLLLLLVVAGVLVIGAAGAAGAYFLGLFGSDTSHAAVPAHEAGPREPATISELPPKPPAVSFVDMPDILVNLQAPGARMRFLKLRVSLEVPDDATAQVVKTVMPRIQDSFQLYLRALTVEDLAGPDGVQRLKEDLVARSSLAVDPVRISDVLVKEMLVQ